MYKSALKMRVEVEPPQPTLLTSMDPLAVHLDTPISQMKYHSRHINYVLKIITLIVF